MNKPLLQFDKVWKTYHMGKVSLDVLKGISFTVQAGEFLSIIGPSGSGKTTLMNLIGILDVPSKGSIILEGVNVSKLSESGLAQIRGRKIGFVFQQFNLIPTLTALENVILPTIFQNLPEEERVKRAQKLLAEVGLGERMHHRPTELSGGQQQRVAIARALVNNPEIILADEPTGNLDSKSGEHIMDLLLQLHLKEKKTIVLVTHDVDLLEHTERTIFLKDGEIVKIQQNRSRH